MTTTEASGKFDRIAIRYEYSEALRQFANMRGIRPEELLDKILMDWFLQLERDVAVLELEESIKGRAKRVVRRANR